MPRDVRADFERIAPAWRDRAVGAFMTTRRGGASRGPYADFNLGMEVGDEPAAAADNRRRFADALEDAAPVFLKQVHGTRVVTLTAADAADGAPVQVADARVTAEPGLAGVVQVADCLPILFAAPDGAAVAAAHAGWRGLAAGVVEATVEAICAAARCEPGALRAWLGAGIGPRRFEVGGDVVEAFTAAGGDCAAARGCFAAHGEKWLADLPALARLRLSACGVRSVSGGEWCTVEDASRFYSFRRDSVTGRMAAAVWIRRRDGR